MAARPASLPAERRAYILKALAEGRVVTVAALCRELGVSPMTVHRDLHALEQESLVVRVRGGAMAPQAVRASPPLEGHAGHRGAEGAALPAGCAACGAPVRERTLFAVQRADGSRQLGCCGHCGILLVEAGARSAVAADYLRGHMVNARSAWYLVGPELIVCCSPPVLVFAHPDEARRFRRGFGGEVVDLAGALERVRAEMALSRP